MKIVAVLVLVVGLVSCAKSPTSPSDLNVTGTWSGTVSTTSGTQTVTGVLAQSGTSINGTWTAKIPGSPSLDTGGLVIGSKSAAAVSLSLIPNSSLQCTTAYAATVSSATQMSGTASATNCPTGFPVPASITLALTKQ